jgi:hypothetical protein
MTIFRAGATPAVGLVSWTTQTSQGNPVVMADQNHMAPWNEMQSGWPRLSSKIRWGSSEGCVLRWIEHRICCPDIPGTFSRFHAPSIFLRFHDCLEHAYIFFRYTDTRSTLTPKTCFFCFFYSSCTLDHKILRPDESGLSLGTVDQGGDVVSSFFIRW